jgi:energy-coupling factor transporter transmembrane protein EcfT
MFDHAFNQRRTSIHTLDPRFKIAVSIIFSTVMALSTHWSALGVGLLFALVLCVLARLSAGKMVLLFFFTYRHVHVIHQEYQRLIRTLKVRGFRNRTSLHTYRTYAYLVGMLMVKTYERAERLHKAMICRGFNGAFYDLSEFTVTTQDVCIFVSMLLPVAGIVLLQWRGVVT